MAGVIKSKGNEIFTTGVRRVSADTGDSFVSEALQRASSRISDAMYSDAVRTEKETGRQAAITAPIKREDGKIVFEDITQDMSRVARNAARPILEQNYGRALKVDIDRALIEAHKNSSSAAEFQQKSKLALEGILDAVPDDFQLVSRSVIESSASTSQNQHLNAMLLDEARDQERIRLENLQLDYQDQIDTVEALMRQGEIGAAMGMRDAILTDLAETGTEDGLTDQNIKAIRDRVDNAYMGTLLLREAERLLDMGDEETVILLERALHSGFVPDDMPAQALNQDDADDFNESNRISITKLISQEQVDSIQNYAVRQAIAADLSVLRNKRAAELSADADRVATDELAMQLSQGIAVAGGQKNQKRMDAWFGGFGIQPNPDSWSSDATMQTLESNPQLLAVLTQGSFLPFSLEATFKGVATGNNQLEPNQLQNLTRIYNLATKGIGMEGNIHRPKGFDDATLSFWESVHLYANSYGASRISEGVQFLNMRNGNIEELQNSIKISFNKPNMSAEQIITERLYADQGILDGKLFSDKMTPGTIKRLMPIALRAYGSLPPDQADEIVSGAYQAIFTETDLIRAPISMGNRSYKRHEFSPEAFYGTRGIAYDEFRNFAARKIKANTGAQVDLGTTHFLWPSNQSTNRSIMWTVVDANGEFVRNANGKDPLIIRSREINSLPAMQNAFKSNLDRKLERARNVRTAAMRLAEENAVSIVPGGAQP
jgi:hypothetical protein